MPQGRQRPVFKEWREETKLTNETDPRPGREKIRTTLCCWVGGGMCQEMEGPRVIEMFNKCL